MFVLSTSYESGGKSAEADIFVDTTDPEMLRLGEKLQELIYRIGSVRLPICDLSRYRWEDERGFDERGIVIMDPGMPARGTVPAYRIFMSEVNRSYSNPPMQIQILALKPYTTEAVSEFTKAAFGIPLAELENRDFHWPKRDVVAISEDFKAITRAWSSGPVVTNDIKHVDFRRGQLGDVAACLATLTQKPVIVTSWQGAGVTWRCSPEVPLQDALNNLTAALRTDSAFLTNIESRYFRIVDAYNVGKPPAPNHIEVRLEKDQITADQQPVTLGDLVALVSTRSNEEFEVWVYDAGHSTNLNFDSVGKALVSSVAPCLPVRKEGFSPSKLFREFLPKH
jgi:hypothetical protein